MLILFPIFFVHSSFRFSGGNPSIFASSSPSTRDNISATTYYIFAGYNPIESDNGIYPLVSFTVLVDWCSIISDAESCLVADGCQWCVSHGNNTNNSTNTTGVCIKIDSPYQCNATIHRSNTTISSKCSVNELETRDCSTFTSCSTCKSDFGGNSQRCKWCRCKVCESLCICQIFCAVFLVVFVFFPSPFIIHLLKLLPRNSFVNIFVIVLYYFFSVNTKLKLPFLTLLRILADPF